jgi:hypothetical protein
MENHMNKQAFRMFKRNGTYYVQNNQTGKQKSLRTTDKAEANSLLEAQNRARQPAAVNLEIGKAYLRAADPAITARTWQVAMDELASHGKTASQERCKREMASKPFNLIRSKPMIETTREDLKAVLARGGSATNNYLRRLHNLALGNGWIFAAIIPPRQWDKPAKRPKRGITFEEHSKIIAAEKNEERRNYYEMLWLIGIAQTDGSLLTSENLNWGTRVLSYQRLKTGEWAFLQIGESLEALLKKLPENGFLFPKIATLSDNDRSAEFSRRVVGRANQDSFCS